ADTALKDVQSFAQRLENEWIDKLNDAKRRNDLAGAAQKLAEAGMTKYTLEFAKEHGGQLPGYNQWLGMAAAFTDVLRKFGWSESDKSISDIDWKRFLFEPFGHWKELFGKSEK
ncbi:MAG: hypothetical protein IJM60_03895, partial [Bacteroidales bacterium]|nr:hypothetical protein [Bacteroidales bacterium]